MSSDSAPERYRRRTRWPALVIVGVLALATAITWTVVLQPEPSVDNSCNPPGAAPITTSARGTGTDATASEAAAATGAATDATATGAEVTVSPGETTSAPISTTLGAFTDPNTLNNTRPADPAAVRLRVVNASTTPGLARTVTEALRRAGFESIQEATDDPLYPAADLRCVAEIRYGPAGSQAARTLLVVAPCATLVQDARFDDSIELALGALYEHEDLTEDQIATLTDIKRAATPPAVLEGITQVAQTTAPIPPLPTAECPS